MDEALKALAAGHSVSLYEEAEVSGGLGAPVRVTYAHWVGAGRSMIVTRAEVPKLLAAGATWGKRIVRYEVRAQADGWEWGVFDGEKEIARGTERDADHSPQGSTAHNQAHLAARREGEKAAKPFAKVKSQALIPLDE